MIKGFISKKFNQNVSFNVKATTVEIDHAASSAKFSLNFVGIHASY